MSNRQKQNGSSPIEPGDQYNKNSLSSLIKDKSIKSPLQVKQKKNEMEKSFYQGFDRDQSMTKIAFFNQNKLAQSTTLLTSSISSPKFNKTQKKFHIKNSIKDSPIKIQPAPSQSHLAQYLLKKDIKSLQTLVAIRDRVPEDDEERSLQPIMIQDRSEPQHKKVFNMTQNVDHSETKKMLVNINQYKDNEMNVDLDYEYEQKEYSKQKLTIEEEFNERVRRMKKKEYEIEQRKYFEDKICNKPSPMKKTMDNRVKVDINKKIDPNLREFFPREHNFDKYQFYEGRDQQSKLDEIQKQTVFARNNKFNKKQIFNKMVELIYMNASQHINRATADNPQVLNANKNHWFQMMLKNPKLQKFYSHFNEQLSVIIKEEIDNNKSNFDLFMIHPRPEKGNICNLYPTQRMLLPEEKRKEMRMINNSIDDAKQKYNYKKEKKKLIEQMRHGREKTLQKDIEHSHSVDKAKLAAKLELQGRLKKGLSNLFDQAKINAENKKNEVVEKPLSDFQMLLKEQAGNIDILLADLDQDNDTFKTDLKSYEDAHNELRQTHGQFMSIIPGKDIEKLMEEWHAKNNELDIDHNEFNKFAFELALSLKEYETKLKDEMKGHEIELAYKSRMFELKFADLQSKTQMQMEAYTMVLTDLKLKHQLEYERINMYNSELESKILNSAIPEYQIDELVKQVDEGLVLKNTIDARGYIQRLANMVKSQQKTVKMFKELAANSDSFVSVANDNMIKERASSKVNITLRHYYQRLLMKLIRDCGILESDEHEKDLENFLKINEFSERDQDQKFYRRILDEIGIEKHLDDFSNKVIGQQANLEEVDQYLDELGLNNEVVESEARLFEIMQEQALERDQRKNSKNKKDKEGDDNYSRPKIGYIEMKIDKITQDDVQTLLRHAISGHLEELVATKESGMPDYDRVESQANIEEQLRDLGESKPKILRIKKNKSGKITLRKKRSDSKSGLELGLKTPDSDQSRASFQKGQQSANAKMLNDQSTPKIGSETQITPIQNTVILEDDVGEVSPTPDNKEAKKEDELLAEMTGLNSTDVKPNEDQDIEPKKSDEGGAKVPQIDVDDASDKSSKEQIEAENTEDVPVVKQIIMSSDSSSEKEESKKEEKSEKSEVNKNLLNIKKKKPPMIRLNSKPVLALQSKNNKDIASFKSKLEEGLKQKFEDLLTKIQEDIAQQGENQSQTPSSNQDDSKSINSSIKSQSIGESIRSKSAASPVSKRSKVITSSESKSKQSEKVDSISITSSIKGSVSDTGSNKDIGARSKTRPPSRTQKNELLDLKPVKKGDDSKSQTRPPSNTSSRPQEKVRKSPTKKLSKKEQPDFDKISSQSPNKENGSSPKAKKIKIVNDGDKSKNISKQQTLGGGVSKQPKKGGDKSKNMKGGDKSKNMKGGDKSKNVKDGSQSKNMGLKNTDKKGKIKLSVKPKQNKKAEKAKDEIKKNLKIHSTLITETSKDKNEDSDLEIKSQSSISIKSSNSLSSGEENDRIISLKKIATKKIVDKALPIVGDLSIEMRQSSRNVAKIVEQINEGVLSKVSSIIKPRQMVFNEDGEEVEQELKPIITVDDTLNNLYVPKYKKTIHDADKEAKKADGFKLNAKAIQDFQAMVEQAMGSTIGYDDSQRMFDDPSIQSFFDIYSELVAQQFKFESINKFINNRGEVEEEEIPEEVKQPEAKKKKKGKKGKKETEQEIVFGDIIKPTFAETGEFIGVQIRTELTNAIYIQYYKEQAILKRILNCCSFINRMMRDGMKDDFMCIQLRNGEVAKKGREFKDSSTETEEKYFEKVAAPLDDTNMLVFWSLKEHIIDLLTRLNPSKRSYQNLMWEERTIIDLWNYQLPNIYNDYSHFAEDENTQITFGDYLNGLFKQMQIKLDQAIFPNGHKEKLIIERFIKLGMDQDDKIIVKIPINVAVQCSVYMKEQEAQTISMPGYTTETLINEMLPKKPTKTRIRKDGPKNQLILDRELENQFEQTLDLFDVYVNNLSFIDQQRFNDQEFNKVKLEVDMNNNTLKDNTEKKKSNKDPKNKTSMDTQEDMEYDVKKIREKLNFTIDEINADPQLFDKFKKQNQQRLDEERAANPMKVFDLKPDKVGWLNETSKRDLKELNHDSTENTLYDHESSKSKTFLPLINTSSNFSKNLSHASVINVKTVKHTNSPETTGDFDPRERMNNTTLNQSQSHQQQNSMFHKPSATIMVKPNLRASMQNMNTTRNNLNKSFVFKDPLDDIVTRKRKKVSHMKSNSLYQSHVVPSQAMTNTDIDKSDLQALRHRNETIGQFIERVERRDNLPIPNQILDRAIINRGKNFEWFNGEIQQQWSQMTKNQFNQSSIQRLYNTIDKVQENENVMRDNERYKRTMMDGFGNKMQQANKFNSTQSSLSYLSPYKYQMRMTQIDKTQMNQTRESHFNNPKQQQPHDINGVQKFTSPLKIHSIIDPYSPQSKIKMLQMKAQAVGMGTQCDDETPNVSMNMQRNIAFKTLTSQSSQNSVKLMDQIIHKKPVLIENNYKPRGQYESNNFGNKDSYRPDTEENQVFLTNKFNKQHMVETDDEMKTQTRGTVEATERNQQENGRN